MIPGFKYHVATIAAIFLALGVGIIIGSSFVQSAIIQHQTRLLDDLKTQFNSEVVALRDDNRRYQEFMSALTPSLLANRLAGKRVAIVQTGDYPDSVRKIRETLEQAGATVSSVTAVDPGFPVRSGTNLPTLLPKLQTAHPNLPSDASSVLKVLAVLVSRGGPDTDLNALADAELIQNDGDYSKSNDFVVLVGGASEEHESRAERLDLPLIQQIKDLGSTVIAAEPEQAAISYVPVVRDANISTIDNVDTDIGRVALVLAMRSERGNWGVKKTAQSGILPPYTPSYVTNGSNTGVQ